MSREGRFIWLSYRGEYDIRHESVVMIQDEKIIKDTTEYIEVKFVSALEKELEMFLVSDGSSMKQSDILNWMKELILLDSLFEKRKQLADQLVNLLREHHKDELIHEIACLWVRYNGEDFGVRSYLSELLQQEQLELAKDYFSLCLAHIQTSAMWDKLPGLQDYKEWMKEQISVRKPQTRAVSKSKKRVKK